MPEELSKIKKLIEDLTVSVNDPRERPCKTNSVYSTKITEEADKQLPKFRKELKEKSQLQIQDLETNIGEANTVLRQLDDWSFILDQEEKDKMLALKDQLEDVLTGNQDKC